MLMALAGALSSGLFAGKDTLSGSEDAKIVAMLFYADWCSSCKVLDPKVETAKKAFADSSVKFAKIDLTNDATRAESEKLAETLGATEAFYSYGSRTGFMLLVEKASGEVLSMITMSKTVEQIEEALTKALES